MQYQEYGINRSRNTLVAVFVVVVAVAVVVVMSMVYYLISSQFIP